MYFTQNSGNIVNEKYINLISSKMQLITIYFLMNALEIDFHECIHCSVQCHTYIGALHLC